MVWRIFERGRTKHPRCAVLASTKARAEILAFDHFHRPMDVDLARGDCDDLEFIR